MKARIIVTPKKTVLDPQGKAVEQAIHHLGMDCVKNTRIGRFIEMDIDGSNLELTKKKLNEICRDLLSNPVIEDYHLELEK
jgi:phosphoribosylformylglycinamidine synthase